MKIISLSAVLGIIISLALFWLMQMMISNNQQGFKKTKNIQMTEFVRLKRETKLQTKDRKIPDEPPPENRPPPPKMQMQQAHVTQNNVPKMDMPALDIPLQTEKFSGSLVDGLQTVKGDNVRNAIPLAQGKSRQKTSTSKKKIKGWVKLEFIINKNGRAKNIVVVDANPPKKYNKRAIKLIRRSKFSPKIINGKAEDQLTVQRIEF